MKQQQLKYTYNIRLLTLDRMQAMQDNKKMN